MAKKDQGALPTASTTPVKTAQDITDEKIQGTNDSSIVSKRSVERLYWSKQAPGSGSDKQQTQHVEFFRPFVSKPQRRSPNINRGYWTRMEAITRHIEHVGLLCTLVICLRLTFKIIESSTCEKNVIINLGCGL